MVFSSLTFLFAFLPIVLVLYYLMPNNKAQNVIILISGIVFYAWGEPLYVFAMLLSTAIDFCAGLIIHKYDDKPKVRLACLIVSLVMNIGLLSVFKYLGFLINSANMWFGWNIPNPNLPLPIGISFFTFQSMSYTIDLYRRNIKVQKNPVSFIAFVSLFPQIVAGPIVRYEDVQNEIDNRTITEKMVGDGICRFITGLGKKVLIANNIGMLWTTVKAMEYTELSAATAWLGILAFTFQIFFDFSGYSDMAIGLGKMLGFHFLENFNYPYISKSITEFWRRWHISLGSWFRDYVYIPLGGNRKGPAKHIRNICIVWLLTGIWHGANWNFIIWGVYFGILLLIEKFFLGKILQKLPAFVSHIYTLFLVVISWAIFAIEDMSKLGKFLAAMFGAGGSFADNTSMYLLVTNAILFVILAIAATPAPKKIAEKLLTKLGENPAGTVIKNVAFVAIFIICTAFLVANSYNPFLYFRF